MEWYRFVRVYDSEVSEMNYRNLRKDLSERFKQSKQPLKFKGYFEFEAHGEGNYIFSPLVGELAKDILDTYGAFSVPAPKSTEGMRQLKF